MQEVDGTFVVTPDCMTLDDVASCINKLHVAIRLRAPDRTHPGWIYLCGRDIDPAKLPPALVSALRWLPNMRGEEGWLLSPFTDEVGTITALHITHITPQGELSQVEPRRIVNRGPANWGSSSLLRYESGIGSEFVVAETRGLPLRHFRRLSSRRRRWQ